VRNKLLWGLILLFSSGGALKASLLERIPVDSWIYPAVDRLYTSGIFPELHRSLRPYTRGQIAEYLLSTKEKVQSGQLELRAWQGWQIEKLEDELADELRILRTGPESDNQARINPLGVARLSKTEDDPVSGRGQLFLSGSWEWGNRFVFQSRAVVDNRGEEDPDFFAQEWKKGITGMFDRGYLGLKIKPLYLTVGRDYLRWGPGQQGLLISSNAPALDFLSFQLGSGRLRFSFFTSRLDTVIVSDTSGPMGSANRYISGHRLNFKHPAGWEIGFSEIIVYGGIDRPVELFYLNPVLPYYVEQYNRNVDDNSLWNLEIALSLWKDKEFYAELVIDDFQYDFVSEPHQLGFLIGTRLADLFGWSGSYWNLQYTRVGTFVYGQQKAWNRYTYQDVVLGHLFGSDFDLLQMNLDYIFHQDFTLFLGGSYKRQGEMTPDSVYPDQIAKGVPFPSGTVEKIWTGSAGLRFQPDAHLAASLDLSYQDLTNYQHLSGKKHSNWEILIRLDYSYWKEFWF
jgi:hypothetical protein